MVTSTCTCSDSRIHYLYLFFNMVTEHNTILFGLKLSWGFRNLWRCSNKNKGRSYHISPTTKIGVLSSRLFIIIIHGSDAWLAAPHPSTRKSHIWHMCIECSDLDRQWTRIWCSATQQSPSIYANRYVSIIYFWPLWNNIKLFPVVFHAGSIHKLYQSP